MRPLIDVNQHEEIKSLMEQLRFNSKRAEARVKELADKARTIQKENEKIQTEVWDQVKKYLKERDLLKDYDTKKHCLEYDRDENWLYMMTMEEAIEDKISGLIPSEIKEHLLNHIKIQNLDKEQE